MVRFTIPLLLSSVVVGATAAALGQTYIQYSTVTGYFLQDDNSTNATAFDYVSAQVYYHRQALESFSRIPIC